MKLALFVVLLLCQGTSAETLDGVKSRVDTWLTNRFSVLVSRQTNYFNVHGKYFQGKKTHDSVPAHTNGMPDDKPGNRLGQHPTDQPESWDDAIPELNGESLAGAIRIDVFDGPNGKGWMLTLYIEFEGVFYKRVKTIGNETWRDSDWAIISGDEI